MKVWTSTINYSGPCRYDVTRKTGDTTFAPTWEMITQYKHGFLTDDEYTQLYYRQLKINLAKDPAAWDRLLGRDEVVLVCYCPAGQFCHRHLLKDLLRRLCKKKDIPFEDGGEIVLKVLLPD